MMSRKNTFFASFVQSLRPLRLKEFGLNRNVRHRFPLTGYSKITTITRSNTTQSDCRHHNVLMYRIPLILLLFPTLVLAQEAATFVPPPPAETLAANSLVTGSAAAVIDAPAPLNTHFVIASRDSILGDRIARVSAITEQVPQDHGQIGRSYDITPYTKERKLPTGSPPPEQVLVDWILRKTGAHTWHTGPFSILHANSEELHVYHTREQQLIVADIVDRFVCPQLWDEACTLRIVSTSRPDWLNRGHSSMRPVRIATQGVQGWIMEKSAAQNLLQELSRRSDFRELIPPQPYIAHGIQHNVAVTRQRQYLRDVQPNSTVPHGFAEDRETIHEGIGLAITPLAMLDGQHMAATIKLDVVQIERMLSTMIEVATTANSRQRVHIESPQLASFKLDEVVAFPKNMVLLLDLGTVPLPNTADEDSRNVLTEIARGLNPARRGNVLMFIGTTSDGATPALSATPATPAPAPPVRTARPLESPYWQGLR